MWHKTIHFVYNGQINSFGGGIFKTDSRFFITNRIAGTQKNRGTDAAAKAVSPSGRDFQNAAEELRRKSRTAFPAAPPNTVERAKTVAKACPSKEQGQPQNTRPI